jgi:hypothetical protein
MVKVPTAKSWPPLFSIRLLSKVMLGYFSASKKSGLLRCWSRLSIPVSMLAALIVA